MKSNGVRPLIVLGVLATAACSDDPTGGGNLSEAEAQQLASAVLTTALSVYGMAQAGAFTPAPGPAPAPFGNSYTWEGTVSCPGGGSATATASVAVEGETTTGEYLVEMEFTQIHQDCIVMAAGDSFTFSGNPSVVVSIAYEFDGEGAATYSGSILGGLGYEFDGRSGTCTIDYAYAGSTNTATGSSSYSLSGSVCGVSMSYDYSVG